MRRITLAATSLTVWLVAALADIAAAASGNGEQVGQNLGHMLGGWAKSLYAGIAAIVACMFLFNRRFGELAVFVGAAIVVGGFVFASGDIATIAHDIWSTLTA